MGRLRGLAPRRLPIAIRGLIVGVVALAATMAPAGVAAHPLGNFTINTYAGLRLSPSEIRIDLVVDLAEIPTFEARLRLDADGDGQLSDPEVETAREPECAAVAGDLALSVDGSPIPLTLAGSGLSFPRGAVAGTPTMRLACEYVAGYGTDRLADDGAAIAFANRVYEGRLGWREVVVAGDGVTVRPTDGDLSATSVSERLTRYPADLLAIPLDVSSASLSARPGGPALTALRIPEITWRDGLAPDAAAQGGPVGPAGPGDPVAVVVPGGVAPDIPAIFQTADLSPALALLAIGTALVLGAAHAVTPGHGKTLMAAYLVGARGTARHAAGLGLSVTVSHTLGILALAVIINGAQSALPPDVVVRALPTIAAVTIVAIGAWMVASEVRRRRTAGDGAAASGPEVVDPHDHDHDHGHDEDHAHDHPAAVEHRHGAVRHSHVPDPGATITWRSLFTLGLAGGLIPSTSALVILLGTIATGRTAFGIILVVAFGIGMAVVLAGVGLLLVRARVFLERMPRRSTLGRLAGAVPLLAAVAVLGIGLWLTYQGVAGRPVL